MHQQSMPKAEFSGQGSVVKSKPSQLEQMLGDEKNSSDVQRVDPLPKSQLPEFNTSVIANGLVDQENEGGRAIARSTGITGMSNTNASAGLGFEMPEEKNKYELTGFVVKYDVPGTKDIASSNVRVYFKTLDEAKAPIKDMTYTHITPDAKTIVCEIIRGAPLISYDEVGKAQYSEGIWKRP